MNKEKFSYRWWPPYPHWMEGANCMGTKERSIQAALGLLKLYRVGMCSPKRTYTVDVYATSRFDAWVYATKVLIPQVKWKKLNVYSVSYIDYEDKV